jgi:hypothetical protein
LQKSFHSSCTTYQRSHLRNWNIMVWYLRLIVDILHKSLMLTKETCLHERVVSKKEPGASPLHSETSDRQARARLPTVEPMILSSHRLNNHTSVNQSLELSAVCEGACKSHFHHRPRVFSFPRPIIDTISVMFDMSSPGVNPLSFAGSRFPQAEVGTSV